MVSLSLGAYLCAGILLTGGNAEDCTSTSAIQATATTRAIAPFSSPQEAFDRFLDESWPACGDARYGDGHFGRWITDDGGRPAYDYRIDQTRDPRATYVTSGGGSRDHWHLIGNDRIVATAHNGGYVQLHDWTRGGRVINRWDPGGQNYAGGFKFVGVGGRAFSTLWQGLPADARQSRVFGMGYFKKVTVVGGLSIEERIESPAGDDPVLLSVTTVSQCGDKAIDVTVVEFWDANPHFLTPGLIMGGRQSEVVQRQRSELNRKFLMDAGWDPSDRLLSVDLSPVDSGGLPGADQPAQVDYHPKTTFLAALDPLPDGFRGYAADQDLFFDGRGIETPCPPGVSGAADGHLFSKRSAYGGKAVMAIRRTIRLAPGQKVIWRYLFGYARKAEIPGVIRRHRVPARPVRSAALEMVAPGLEWLGRELQWHSYYLQAGSLYQDLYQTHFVDQGSAYGYLQGLSGAHRDFALFTLPMVYLRADLARDMLRFSMRSQDARTGALPYAHIGCGAVSGAVLHGQSSDLDMFFLWAFSEYLAATRDLEFLKEQVPFYPPSAGVSGSALDHARAALRHLKQGVGLGPHGLIRCGSGDWNDELLSLSPKPAVTQQRGESALNAGLATVSLSAMAGAIEAVEPSFAAELRDLAGRQGQALRSLWTGDWVARGYLGQADDVLGRDRLFLDAQPFGILGGVWDDRQLRRMLERIETLCVRPQRVGAMSLVPPVKGAVADPGSDTNGGTWAAIDSWLAWAWSRVDSRAAWAFYLTTTLAARAEAYPGTWFGVWSGPDSYNAYNHARPEGTFRILYTPMTDYPVMNMNRHAGPLLDAIRFAGIEPSGGLIRIVPRIPLDSFSIRLPLIGAAYLPNRHRGHYAPIVAGTFRFAVRPPTGLDIQNATLTVNDMKVPFRVDDAGLVRFEAVGSPGRRITWNLR